MMGTAVAQWLRCCATNRKVAVSIPAGVIGNFHWHKILPIALRPWDRLSLKQKWVPGAFPGGKGGRCLRLTPLPPSCAVVMKSGNLNFLEPSGLLQACNGTAYPLKFSLRSYNSLCYARSPLLCHHHHHHECYTFVSACPSLCNSFAFRWSCLLSFTELKE